jgi:hypothetical protein
MFGTASFESVKLEDYTFVIQLEMKKLPMQVKLLSISQEIQILLFDSDLNVFPCQYDKGK